MHNGQMGGPPPPPPGADCNGHLMNGSNGGGAGGGGQSGGPLYISPYSCDYYGGGGLGVGGGGLGAEHNYYYATGPGPEICPAHQGPICTLHEYGKRERETEILVD